MESSLPWSNAYSPNTPAAPTPGKSPYFDMDSHNSNHAHTQNQHDSTTPTNATVPVIGSGDTPANFTHSDHMFLQNLEHNLYESPGSATGSASGGANPGPHDSSEPSHTPQEPNSRSKYPSNQHTQVHHHHHHHHHHAGHLANSAGNTPSNSATPAETTPITFTGSLSMSGGQQSTNTPPPPPPVPPSQFYEFGLENMNFIMPEELNFEDPAQPQTAYPPAAHQPTQTPMLAANKAQNTDFSSDPKRFDSPILPSQDEHSFNNQHYYHKYSKSGDPSYSRTPSTAPHQHVRPDAVFTPLVSPAVTPLDSQVNSNSMAFGQPPVSASFEPLTSPALNAQTSSVDNRRRTSSSAFAVDDLQHQTPSNASGPYHKRRTPHGTPVLSANASSVTSNGVVNRHASPSLKAGRSNGSYKSSPKAFESLPESSMDSANTTPMLPPQGKKIGISHATSSNGSSAPLMGFTMGRLAEHSQNEDSELDPEADFNLDKPKKSASSLSRSSSYKDTKYSKSSSSSTETSPQLKSQKGTLVSDGRRNGAPVAKKASHKLAEQGRRNRMNTAVSELGSLVPKSYHEEVSIPSKATTVELASNYIRDLLDEIERLKAKIPN